MPLAPRVETISWGPRCVRPRRGYGHPDPLQAIDGARFAFIDIISPCVTVNDHDGSTKSYAHTREHKVEVVQADFVPPADEITTEYQDGSSKNVMMHDGSWVKFRKLAKDYDPTDRDGAYAHIREHQRKGEVVTGLLYLSPDSKDVHDQNDTVPGALYNCRTPSSARARTRCRS